jgi:DNA-binding NarL/FixJ family response regulator
MGSPVALGAMTCGRRALPGPDPIEVVVVDDHPAVRAGLLGLVQAEPGLTCTAAAGSGTEALDAVRSTGATVVIADYELADTDGLTLCAELKALPEPPGVILYSAFVRPRLLPAAAVAGADAMLDKAAPATQLFDTVRAVARGAARLPAPPPEAMERCIRALQPDELSLFGMAVNGTPVAEIAAVAGDDIAETRRRLRAMLGRLQQHAVLYATDSPVA